MLIRDGLRREFLPNRPIWHKKPKLRESLAYGRKMVRADGSHPDWLAPRVIDVERWPGESHS